MSPDRKALRSAVLAALFGTLAFAVIRLAGDLHLRFSNLSTAQSDNVQWVLSQVEVEHLVFLRAVLRAELGGEDDLADLRARFDIFYSRMRTLRTSALFTDLRELPAFDVALKTVWTALNETVPAIDGPAEGLLGALPEIDARFEGIRPAIRSIGLNGITHFAEAADAQRLGFLETLRRLAVMIVLLVVLLSATVIVLGWQWRLTRRHAAAAEISGARMAAVVRSSLDAVLVADVSGRVLEANAAVEEVFGYTPGEIVGRRISETVVPQENRAAHEAGMARFVKTGEARVVGQGRIQLNAIKKDGTPFPVELSISSAESAEGPIFVSFLRDISHRLAAERELRAAHDAARASERATSRMLAVMSHEMRTPLNGIVGSVDLLDDAELTPEAARLVRVIAQSADVLRSHVDDVLDISRLDAGRMVVRREAFSINAVLRDLVDSQTGYAASLGNALEATPIDGGDTVWGDPSRLRQILLNLVGNALKFTENGEVSVEVERLPTADFVEFRVIDTGIGIAEDQLDRIWEDFVTLDGVYDRARGGTGLGLGIVRRMVKHLGGDIGVESEPGEGSLFWLRLPLPITKAKAIGTAGVEPDARHIARHVLLVEDNPLNRSLAVSMLQKLGHSVEEAEDGAAAVALAERTRFDIILMDISMPKMDGVTATQHIRAGTGASCSAPIIALTAHALPDERARFRAAGMVQTLVKPVTRKGLAQVLSSPAALEPAVAETAAPPGEIDRDALAALTEETDAARLKTLLDAFIAETDHVVSTLTPEMATGLPPSELLARLHRLAGSAAMFGAGDLRAELAALEGLGKAGEIDEVVTRLANLPPLWALYRPSYVRLTQDSAAAESA